MTPVPEMVERVARAMWEVDSALNWEDEMADYIMMARAAIEAMREPTQLMAEAGMKERRKANQITTADSLPYRVYCAHIDAALEPTKDATTARADET